MDKDSNRITALLHGIKKKKKSSLVFPKIMTIQLVGKSSLNPDKYPLKKPLTILF